MRRRVPETDDCGFVPAGRAGAVSLRLGCAGWKGRCILVTCAICGVGVVLSLVVVCDKVETVVLDILRSGEGSGENLKSVSVVQICFLGKARKNVCVCV